MEGFLSDAPQAVLLPGYLPSYGPAPATPLVRPRGGHRDEHEQVPGEHGPESGLSPAKKRKIRVQRTAILRSAAASKDLNAVIKSCGAQFGSLPSTSMDTAPPIPPSGLEIRIDTLNANLYALFDLFSGFNSTHGLVQGEQGAQEPDRQDSSGVPLWADAVPLSPASSPPHPPQAFEGPSSSVSFQFNAEAAEWLPIPSPQPLTAPMQEDKGTEESFVAPLPTSRSIASASASPNAPRDTGSSSSTSQQACAVVQGTAREALAHVSSVDPDEQKGLEQATSAREPWTAIPHPNSPDYKISKGTDLRPFIRQFWDRLDDAQTCRLAVADVQRLVETIEWLGPMNLDPSAIRHKNRKNRHQEKSRENFTKVSETDLAPPPPPDARLLGYPANAPLVKCPCSRSCYIPKKKAARIQAILERKAPFRDSTHFSRKQQEELHLTEEEEFEGTTMNSDSDSSNPATWA